MRGRSAHVVAPVALRCDTACFVRQCRCARSPQCVRGVHCPGRTGAVVQPCPGRTGDKSQLRNCVSHTRYGQGAVPVPGTQPCPYLVCTDHHALHVRTGRFSSVASPPSIEVPAPLVHSALCWRADAAASWHASRPLPRCSSRWQQHRIQLRGSVNTSGLENVDSEQPGAW